MVLSSKGGFLDLPFPEGIDSPAKVDIENNSDMILACEGLCNDNPPPPENKDETRFDIA